MAMEIPDGERAWMDRNDARSWQARHDTERRRLAMLWKAFLEAEARIASLEAQLAQRGVPVVTEVVAPPTTRVVEKVIEVPTEEPLHPEPRYPVAQDKVAKLPGITAGEIEKLRTYGINLTDALLHADLDKLTEATGITRDRLQRLRDISELIALNGIGPTWAARLVDADITSIPQLAKLEHEELESILLKSYEKQGASEEKMVLFRRTLPARCKTLVTAARKAAKQL